MKERRETLCRLVQIPRQKVKTPPKTYPRRIFKEARDAGGGVFLADPPPIWEGESAVHAEESRAAGPENTQPCGDAARKEAGKASISRRGDRAGP